MCCVLHLGNNLGRVRFWRNLKLRTVGLPEDNTQRQILIRFDDVGCLHERRDSSSKVFGPPFVKWFALYYQTVACLSCLSVCDGGALWQNGPMDHDESWQGGRPRPQPDCYMGIQLPPSKKGTATQFTAHVCCGRTAEWINMPLGTEVGLGPGHIVLDGYPAYKLC